MPEICGAKLATSSATSCIFPRRLGSARARQSRRTTGVDGRWERLGNLGILRKLLMLTIQCFGIERIEHFKESKVPDSKWLSPPFGTVW